MGKTKKTQPRGLGRGRRRNFGELRSKFNISKEYANKNLFKNMMLFYIGGLSRINNKHGYQTVHCFGASTIIDICLCVIATLVLSK
jgi:hypothetical protein